MNLKQYQCQASNIITSVVSRFVVTFIVCLLFLSCAKEWDPDQQFNNDVKTIIAEKEISDWQNEQRAIENLKSLDMRIRQELRIGTTTFDFYQLVGQSGNTLASRYQNDTLWESKSYYWHQIVSHHFGLDSQEYDKCAKSKVYLEATLGADRVISLQMF